MPLALDRKLVDAGMQQTTLDLSQSNTFFKLIQPHDGEMNEKCFKILFTESVHDPQDIALAPDRIASLILLNKILTSYNFLLPKRYSHWSSSFLLTILANTNPKASAAPNKACNLTQKYLAMKILSLSL